MIISLLPSRSAALCTLSAAQNTTFELSSKVSIQVRKMSPYRGETTHPLCSLIDSDLLGESPTPRVTNEGCAGGHRRKKRKRGRAISQMPIFHPRRVGRRTEAAEWQFRRRNREGGGKRSTFWRDLSTPPEERRRAGRFFLKKEKNMMDTMRTGRKFLMAPVPIVDCSSPPCGNSILKSFLQLDLCIILASCRRNLHWLYSTSSPEATALEYVFLT